MIARFTALLRNLAIVLAIAFVLPVAWIINNPGDSRKDFAQLATYHQANKEVASGSIVFLGDSITANWDLKAALPSRFLVNRGIGGQTTGQMLLRFHQDVVDLHPKAVVILGGVNDLCFGTDDDRIRTIEMNIESMVDLAEAHQIRPILATVLPVVDNNQIIRSHPNAAIREINAWLRSFAGGRSLTLIDYASVVRDRSGELRRDFTADGVHPSLAGYIAMAAALRSEL